MNKIIATSRATLVEFFRSPSLRGWLLLLVVSLGVATVASEWTVEPPEETLWVVLSVVLHGVGGVFAVAVGLAAAVSPENAGPMPAWRMLARSPGSWLSGRLLAMVLLLCGVGLAGALLEQSFMILGGFGLMTNPDRLFWGFGVGAWVLLASMAMLVGSAVSRRAWRWPLAIGLWVMACLAEPAVGDSSWLRGLVGVHQYDLSGFIAGDASSMPSAKALGALALQLFGMTLFFSGLTYFVVGIRGTHD